MSNYSPIVNYAAKDAFTTGDPNKRILGTEITAELNSIATMSSTKEDSANKNNNNGYAGLDGTARLAKAQGHAQTAYKDEANTWALAQTFSAQPSLSGTGPSFQFDETDAVADERIWRFVTSGGDWSLRTLTDALGTGVSALSLVRTGTTVNSAAWLVTSMTLNGVSLNNAAILTAGTIPNARIQASGVTQHQAALSILTSQLSGTLVNGTVAVGNVTQHQASLAIGYGQLVDTSIEATLAASQDDYAPTGHATATIMRFDPNGNTPATITGLAGGVAGRRVRLMRQQTVSGGTIAISVDSASSTAANRFNTTGTSHQPGSTVTLNTSKNYVDLMYDGTLSRWIVFF